MPLSMMKAGGPCTIKKVGGKAEIRRFLENIGFVIGAVVNVVSDAGGNMIVDIKDSRVAIGRDMSKNFFDCRLVKTYRR